MGQHVLLIVVADGEQRHRFHRALRPTRHHLVFASDGEDGLLRFHEARPDLVLAEASSTLVSGESLSQRIREGPTGSRVPLVVFGPQPALQALDADATLLYPFESRGLLSTIAPLLAYGRPELEDPEDEGARWVEPQTVVGFENPLFGALEYDDAGPEEPTPVGRTPVVGLARKPGPEDEVSTLAAVRALEPRPPADSGDRDPRLLEEPQRDDAVGVRRARGPGRGLDESQLGVRLTQRIRTLHAALSQADDYQILGLEPDADEAQIHAAWFELSLELHPDRFFLLRSGELKEKIYALYRRVSEAHRVLGDPERRRNYDRARQEIDAGSRGSTSEGAAGLGSEGLNIEASDPSARLFAERAQIAFERGAYQEARFYLHAVLACEANNSSAQWALERVEARVRAPA